MNKSPYTYSPYFLEQTLPGTATHAVTGHTLVPPFPAPFQLAVFGMGCFWGAEKLFWEQEGVYSTAVGYSAGFTSHPDYQQVCSGQTGHCEVILAVHDPAVIDFSALLKLFWEGHDPTQGMRQGNDRGSQYRSMIQIFNPEQKQLAENTRTAYQRELARHGYPRITTEIIDARPFYYAEDAHQQYLAKNPAGYCGLGGIGVPFI